MSSRPFYNFNRIRGYNAPLSLVVGARGLGKTYGAQKIAIRDYIKKGEEFIYLRRGQKELAKAKASFFRAVGSEFPEYDFRVNGDYAEMAPIDTREVKKRQWFIMGYFVALSVAQNAKSTAYPKVTKIIFDEFILENGLVHYLPNEASTVINFYNTVDRYEDRTTMFMLSNAVSINNPYMIAWDINPEEGKEFIVKNDGFIVCHFPNSKAFADSVYATRFGQFIKDTEYADYAVGNTFEDNNSELVSQKDPNAHYRFTLNTKSRIRLSIWYNSIDGIYYVQQKQPKNTIERTMETARVTERMLLMHYRDKPLAALRTAFNQGKVFFDGPRSKGAFLEIWKV